MTKMASQGARISQTPTNVTRGRLTKSAAVPGQQQTERICYVHVGTHKTGTTSIQAFLAENRERFGALDVFFPTAGSDNDPGVISHHQLAMELLGNAAFNMKCGGLADVARELRATTARVACLSSEDFTFLHASPEALVQLRDAICAAGFEPRIVFYLRAQASYCTAVYAENVRHGYRAPFDNYLRDVTEHGCYTWAGGTGPPYDYVLLLDRFAAVFGRRAIVAKAYRSEARDKALLLSFARLLGATRADIDTFAFSKVRLNGSLNFGDVLSMLNIASDTVEPLRFTPIDLRRLWSLCRRFTGSNVELAWRYHVFVPVFERIDIALALPLRKTRAKTRMLLQARRALFDAARPNR